MSPANMCLKINHSVGRHSKNDPSDVEIVQGLLVENDLLPDIPASFDMLTIIKAIETFQSGFMLQPDGKVDPKGTTFERLQGLGLVEMPAGGGSGWYRYETGDLHKSRIMHFGTADTVQAVLDVASVLSYGLPGYAIGVGDLSTAMGTNLGRHASHLHGLNVDVRPFRKDNLRAATNISDDNYSHDNTLLLVDSFLAHKNVKHILFNDQDIIDARSPRVQHWPGHDNHLHIIMKH